MDDRRLLACLTGRFVGSKGGLAQHEWDYQKLLNHNRDSVKNFFGTRRPAMRIYRVAQS